MSKDYEKLREQREFFINEIKNSLGITYEKARMVYEYLENENIIWLEPGDIHESKAERLFEGKHQTQNELKLKSVKCGNVTFYLKFDNTKTIQTICSIVNISCGMAEKNSFLMAVGLLSIFLSSKTMLEYEIKEKGTAIILALQSQHDYQSYKLSRTECQKKANEILKEHHYSEMDEYIFNDELTKLKELKCIDIKNDIVALKEKVSNQF